MYVEISILLSQHESKTKGLKIRGTWVAQLVEHPISAEVMLSQFVSSSPMSGSMLTAQSLEPASDSVSPFLSALPHSCSVSVCLAKNE